MIKLVRAAFAFCFVASLAACTSAPQKLEAAAAGKDGVQEARIVPGPAGAAKFYFMRTMGIGIGKPDILVNGQVVGSLEAGRYFSVTRPPGRYVLGIGGALPGLTVDYEFQAAAGKTYFIELGPRPQGALGTDAAMAIFHGVARGTPLRPTNPLLAGGFQLYSLTPQEATAEFKKFAEAYDQ